MDWDKLRIFHSVAEKGSLTHAGDVLHLSQSAVSRQIRALEESLNVTLFHRHARGLILTEQGELLYDATTQMVKRLDATAARIRDSEDEVFGELRVTTTTGFGTLWLAPRLPTLFKQYPSLKIDLMLEERVLDLPMREADVAIRMKEPSQADLIRKRLMNIKMRLYATPEYLAENGTPQTMDDFAQHRLICQHAGTAQVSAGAMLVAELMSHDIPSTLTVNNYFGVLQGVLNHIGIGEPRPRAARNRKQRSARLPRLPRGVAAFQTGRGLPRIRDRRDLQLPQAPAKLSAACRFCQACQGLGPHRPCLPSGLCIRRIAAMLRLQHICS